MLPRLFERLYPALDALGRSYEVVFVNDGSRDRSVALLREQFQRRPDVTRVVLFDANFGQHRRSSPASPPAAAAIVITLDADLQNPPEEIAKLLAELDAGHDYVGTHPPAAPGRAWRRNASRVMNATARAHHPRPHHRPGLHAARLRAQRHRCGQPLHASSTPTCRRSPIPLRSHPIEIEVAHEERTAGDRSIRCCG